MPPPNPAKRGVWKNSRTHGGATSDDNLVDRVADFTYQSDALAQLIVDIWLNSYANLLNGALAARSAAAKAVLAARGIYLEQPLVITEQEYDAGLSLADANLQSAIVFVVPAAARATTAVGGTPPALLETAKMLMAITPNGI